MSAFSGKQFRGARKVRRERKREAAKLRAASPPARAPHVPQPVRIGWPLA